MSLNSDESPAEGLSDFFNFIWGANEGFVYLPTLDRTVPDIKEGWKSVYFEWPKHRKSVIQHVLGNSAKGLEVYYSPAMFKGVGKPDKKNVVGTSVLWADFDGDAPDFDKWEGTSDADGQERPGDGHTGAQNGALPVPSLRVQSSTDGKEHVYWKLDEFVSDWKWAEDRNRAITYSQRADPGGWDITQILRPPYTNNHKYGEPVPVTVIKDYETEFSRSTFEKFVPPPVVVSESINIGELPAVELIIAKYPWDEEHFKMFMDPHIEEGKRSHALMRLGYFCVEKGMSDTEAYSVLFNADERWGKYKGRSDQKKRLIDIIDRARQKHPNPLSELTFASLLGENKATEGKALIYGFQDFLDTELEVTWAFEGLIEQGGFGMFAAMPAVGKTQAAIQMGICAVLGKDFLGFKPARKMKITLFSLEMGFTALKMLMETIARQYTEEERQLLNENFKIVPLGESVSLDKPAGMAFVETILDETLPDGIIVDSVGKLSLEDLSDKTAKSLNERFAHIRNKYGSWLWFIHHNRKPSDNNKKPTSLGDVYGNVYITTDMTAIFILWPVNEFIEVIPVKMRLSKPIVPFMVQRNENLFFTKIEKAPEVQGFIDSVGGKDDDSGGSTDVARFEF